MSKKIKTYGQVFEDLKKANDICIILRRQKSKCDGTDTAKLSMKLEGNIIFFTNLENGQTFLSRDKNEIISLSSIKCEVNKNHADEMYFRYIITEEHAPGWDLIIAYNLMRKDERLTTIELSYKYITNNPHLLLNIIKEIPFFSFYHKMNDKTWIFFDKTPVELRAIYYNDKGQSNSEKFFEQKLSLIEDNDNFSTISSECFKVNKEYRADVTCLAYDIFEQVISSSLGYAGKPIEISLNWGDDSSKDHTIRLILRD